MDKKNSENEIQKIVKKFLGEQPEIVDILLDLIDRFPQLSRNIPQILKAFLKIAACFDSGHKLFICGNGGSFADSMHISGEMLKSFEKKRGLNAEDKQKLMQYPYGNELATALEYGFPVIVLGLNHSLLTALENDNPTRYIAYAQELHALGNSGDVLLGISTSGNAKNVLLAVITAKFKGFQTIGLTGDTGGDLAKLVDIPIKVPAKKTNRVQELHLPVYHTLCSLIETYYFKDRR